MKKEATRYSTTPQHLLAEFIGTHILVAAVIGSGIMAERMASGNAAVALLGNTRATCRSCGY